MKRQEQSLRNKESTIPCRRLWDSKAAGALLTLFHRSYWRRLWVVQETLYAPDLDVLCGSQRFPWSTLEALQCMLLYSHADQCAGHDLQAARLFLSPAMDLVRARLDGLQEIHRVRTLKSLLYMYKDFTCSDPRDRISALLGLANPRSFSFPHSYAFNARDVYDAVMDLAYGPRAEWMPYARGMPIPRDLKCRYEDLYQYSRDVSSVVRIIDPYGSIECGEKVQTESGRGSKG